MTDLDRLTTALSDRYTVEHELGAGGMATVYLARDQRHGRQVAIKVLRPELAAAIGTERFLAEITTTAHLQHPHILTLLDSGEADGLLYYVMPFVRGESLRQRLEREKQLPVDEAVRIAAEVSGALDYAHREGVIHRDIKPENILLQDGQAMVADFGIALAVSSADGARLTESGLSLGTPQYMSPEQAAGERNLDARADLYSLAAVVYEMLAGEPPHTGPTAQAVLARVALEVPRPLTGQRRGVPLNVAMAVDQALAKVPADRFTSAAGFAAALTDPGFTARTRRWAAVTGETPSVRRRRRLVTWLGWGLAAGALGWLALRPEPARSVSRVAMVLPEGQRLSAAPGNRLALLPDGSGLVYLGEGETAEQVWFRPWDRLVASPVPETSGTGTSGAGMLALSPDGHQLAVRDGGRGGNLRVVSLDGSPVLALNVFVGYDGGTWSEDGYLYLDGITSGLTSDMRGAGAVGLVRVAATGGELERVTTVDTAAGEVDHIWPEALPGGRAVLFTVARGRDPANYDVALVEPGKGNGHRLLGRGVAARYAATGHLLTVLADGTVVGAPFDLRRQELTGEPVTLFDGVGVRRIGAVDLSLSDDGTLAYVTEAAERQTETLVWLTDSGPATPLDPAWTGDFRMMKLSPDGRRLAVTVVDDDQEHIWIKDLPDGPLTRLTVDGTINWAPFWTADGQHLTFVSDRNGTRDLYQKRADGSRPASLLLDLDRPIDAGFRSPDGRWLVYLVDRRDIVARSTAGDSVAIAPTPFPKWGPVLSPDGNFLAYMSEETGRINVFVQPFPDLGAGRWMVPEEEASEPRWSEDGRTLFYRSGGRVKSVRVPPEGDPAMGGADEVLVRGPESWRWTNLRLETGPYTSDVHPDGRYLVIQDRIPSGELVVVRNYFEELRAAFR
jgi:serine/threonine-protein kinase